MEKNIRDEADYIDHGAPIGDMAESHVDPSQRSGLRPHNINLIKRISKRRMSPQREQKWRRRLAMRTHELKHRADAMYAENQKLLNSLPPHKGMVYKYKCAVCTKKTCDCNCPSGRPTHRHILLLAHLLRKNGYEDESLYNDTRESASCLKRGIRTQGPTVVSNIYPPKKGSERPLDDSEFKYSFKCDHPTFGNRDVDGHTVDNVRRIWEEGAEQRNGGLMKEIIIPRRERRLIEQGCTRTLKRFCKFPPIRTFPVEQGERMTDHPDLFKKVRAICNYTNQNFKSKQSEKLQFTGIKEIIEIIYRCLSKKMTPDWNFMQTQADLLADLKEQQARNIRPEDVAKLRKEAIFKRSLEHAVAWLPFMSKEDFKSWFWTWPVEDPNTNIVAYYDPDSKRWRFYETFFGVFGSIHSIYHCCRISEGMIYLLNKKFDILATIYIDDTSIFSPTKQLSRDQHAFVKFFYRDIIGILLSTGKDDAHYLNDRFELLGLIWQIDELAQTMTVGPSQEKKDTAHKEAIEAAVLLKKTRKIPTFKIQKVCGFMNFISTADRFRPGYEVVRPLYIWQFPMLESKFKRENQQRESRHVSAILRKFPHARGFTYMNLIEAAEAALLVQPLVISASDVDRPRVDIVTDLANSEPIMGGGMLSIPNQLPVAFRFELYKADLPKEWSAALTEVAVGELLTVAIARKYFKVKNVNCVCRIDNAYGASSGIRGSARHNVYMTAINKLIQGMDIADNVRSVYSYINTHRNIADMLTRAEKFAMFWKIMGIEPEVLDFSQIKPILTAVDEIRTALLDRFPLLQDMMDDRKFKKIVKKRLKDMNRNSKIKQVWMNRQRTNKDHKQACKKPNCK